MNCSTPPLITIGITCFNAEDLILKSIDCAKKQDWPNYEIIIVDDGSSDDSVKLIRAEIEKNHNIRLICHKQNKGFPASLNTLIKHAQGDYLCFFDDDDFSQPTRLRKQYERLSSFSAEKNSKLVMCYSNRKVEYAQNEYPSYHFTAIGSEFGKEPCGKMVADYILWDSGRIGYKWGMFGSCTLMVHKNLFDAVGLFDVQFRRNAEWDMAIRCALEGGHFIAVNEDLVTQTKTPTFDKAGKKPLKYSLMLRRKYRNYLKNKNLYLVSQIIAYSRFYGGKSKKIKSFSFMLIAAILAPRSILMNKIQKILNQ